jgi:acetoin utilization deacetylase AcuC-like enzyme
MLTLYNDRHVLHGDPHTEYPYYLGYADECGAGVGQGFNLNLPLPRGPGFQTWRAVLAGFDQGAG